MKEIIAELLTQKPALDDGFGEHMLKVISDKGYEFTEGKELIGNMFRNEESAMAREFAVGSWTSSGYAFAFMKNKPEVTIEDAVWFCSIFLKKKA